MGEDEGADRNVNLEVVAVATRAQRSFTLAAAFGGELGCEAEVDERVAVGIGDEIDGAAAAAVAAIGSAARNEFLPAETESAAAAVAGGDMDLDFVYEQRSTLAYSTGRTLIRRPCAP